MSGYSENLARSDPTVIAKFVDFSDETTLDNVINDLLRARQDSQFKDDRDVIFNALGMRGPTIWMNWLHVIYEKMIWLW